MYASSSATAWSSTPSPEANTPSAPQCEAGVAYFQKSNPAIRALRDVSVEQLNAAKGKLDETIFRRCRHVITENQRCLDAAAALQEHRYADAGQLMQQSHTSLQYDYEVSIPELDFLAETAIQVDGVYGARMTGGGFGGCIVGLCKPAAADPLINHLRSGYKQRYKIDAEAFATTATASASDAEDELKSDCE